MFDVYSHSEFHFGNESRIEYTFESETGDRITTDLWLLHEQKNSESKRESRNPKGEQQHRSKKRLPSKHTHTQFYKALLVRSGRFSFAAPKSEGTAVSTEVS